MRAWATIQVDKNRQKYIGRLCCKHMEIMSPWGTCPLPVEWQLNSLNALVNCNKLKFEQRAFHLEMISPRHMNLDKYSVSSIMQRNSLKENIQGVSPHRKLLIVGLDVAALMSSIFFNP